MALRADQLHEENSKLRDEIRKLQSALKSMRVDVSNTDPPSPARVQSWRLNDHRREELISEIKEKLDRGIFSPPKGPRSRGRSSSRRHSGSRSRSTSRDNTRRGAPKDSESSSLQQDLAEELSNIEASLGTIQVAKPELGPSLRKELEQLRKSVGQITGKAAQTESFDSRIGAESETDQIPLKKTSGQTIAKEIETLRLENEYLRMQLTSKPQERSPNRSLTPKARGRSKSRSPLSRSPLSKSPSSKSPCSKSPRSKSPLRLKHCKICDYLLSKGYSTVYCSKHGTK